MFDHIYIYMILYIYSPDSYIHTYIHLQIITSLICLCAKKRFSLPHGALPALCLEQLLRQLVEGRLHHLLQGLLLLLLLLLDLRSFEALVGLAALLLLVEVVQQLPFPGSMHADDGFQKTLVRVPGQYSNPGKIAFILYCTYVCIYSMCIYTCFS